MATVRQVFTPTALTGGTAGSLDAISVTTINHDAMAFTTASDGFHVHVYDAYGTAATNSPSVIRPFDFAGYGNWLSQSSPFGTQQPDVSVVGPYGGIFGGDVTKTGANQLTVTPYSCMDYTLITPIHTSVNTVLTVPSVANAVYILAAVRLLSTGVDTVLMYPTIAAAVADIGVNISTLRLLDYWPTNGSSNACSGVTIDGVKWFDRFLENTINSHTDPPAGITTAINLTTKLPVTMVASVFLGAQAATNGMSVHASGVSGTNQITISGQVTNLGVGGIYEWGLGYDNSFIPLVSNNIYWGEGDYSSPAGTIQLAIHAVKLRR